MKLYRLFILLIICAGSLSNSYAQDDKKSLSSGSPFAVVQKKDTIPSKDSMVTVPAIKKDTVPKHIPRIATRRSALIPGWGQAYNKEYWKIPIVYGILAIPVATYIFNNNYYKKTKFAYEARFQQQNGDTSLVPFIDPELTTLSISSLQNYRNSFRRDRDYSVLWILLAWGLQVADATVFAHLKQFDVSNDLSMEITPTFNPQTRSPGLGLTLNLKNPTKKMAITR
ncbi:MAG: DUF5683 domain-containing protein [Bacteroidota bacterium]